MGGSARLPRSVGSVNRMCAARVPRPSVLPWRRANHGRCCRSNGYVRVEHRGDRARQAQCLVALGFLASGGSRRSCGRLKHCVRPNLSSRIIAIPLMAGDSDAAWQRNRSALPFACRVGEFLCQLRLFQDKFAQIRSNSERRCSCFLQDMGLRRLIAPMPERGDF